MGSVGSGGGGGFGRGVQLGGGGFSGGRGAKGQTLRGESSTESFCNLSLGFEMH